MKKYSLALNPNTPIDILTKLSQDSRCWQLRCFVAENPSTPLEVLASLSQDEDDDVRANVAGNPNTPYGIWILKWGRIPP